MSPIEPEPLSRRERELLDIVYAAGKATAPEVRAAMAEAPSYSAVRALLRVLVEKGHLRMETDGRRNVYVPTRSRRVAGRKALARAVETFFGGDVRDAVAALLDVDRGKLDEAQRARLMEIIDAAREEGR